MRTRTVTAMSNNYIYPDMDDAVTVALLAKEDLWERDEKEILEYAMCLVQRGKIFIDAGCGFGRLIPVFAQHFEKIIAIEPDFGRMQKAKEVIKLAGLDKKVEFVQSPIENVSIKNADTVLSSHVIQHISTDAVPIVLRKMRTMLKLCGLLILTTNNSPREADRFVQSFLLDGKNVEEEIQRTEFERLIGTTGVVPVRQFSSETLANLLRDAGFTVIAQRLFHKGANYPSGRDVLVVAKGSKLD